MSGYDYLSQADKAETIMEEPMRAELSYAWLRATLEKTSVPRS